jgi:hypothetical protein
VNETPRAAAAAQGADCSASRQLRAALERRECGVGLDQFEVERRPVDLTDDHEITGSDQLRVRIGVIEHDPETVPERLNPRFEAGRAERLREIVGITSAGDPGRTERFPPGAPLAHDLVTRRAPLTSGPAGLSVDSIAANLRPAASRNAATSFMA